MSIKIKASYSKPQELPLILSALAPLTSRQGAQVKTVARESRYQHIYVDVMDADDLQLDARLKDTAMARKAEKRAENSTKLNIRAQVCEEAAGQADDLTKLNTPAQVEEA